MRQLPTYDALMLLSVEELVRDYPHGVVCVPSPSEQGQDRWRAADQDEESDKSLTALLRDRRKREHVPVFMRASYSIPRPLLRGGRIPQGATNDNYTTSPERALDADAEVPPAEVVQEYADENRAKNDERNAEQLKDSEAKRLGGRIAKLAREAEEHGIPLTERIDLVLGATRDEIVEKKKRGAT